MIVSLNVRRQAGDLHGKCNYAFVPEAAVAEQLLTSLTGLDRPT